MIDPRISPTYFFVLLLISQVNIISAKVENTGSLPYQNSLEQLEQYHLNTHFRQISTSLTDQPNVPVLERVAAISVCFNQSIVDFSASLVKTNGIPKADAPSFLANHVNTSVFCHLPVPNDCAPPLKDYEIKCDPTYPYRSSNGSCNNLQHTLWGAAEQPFQRLLAPDYEDGVTLPRGFNRSVNPLPHPRAVSNALESRPTTGKIYTSLLFMQWGQFMDHDLTLTPEVETLTNGTFGGLTKIPCCEKNNQNAGTNNKDCFPIDVTGDFFFAPLGLHCLRLARSLPTTYGCQLGQRQQINALTNFADASNVYGSSVEEEQSLRSFVHGTLLHNTKTETTSCPHRGPFPYLPEFTNNGGAKSFFAGDERVIEQPALTSVHSLFLSVHNGLAAKFLEKYPNWSDEEIYQEVRRIVGALIQRITYGEFLPIVIGSEKMKELGLTLRRWGFTDNYQNTINPTTFNEFGIAFRFGHSLIPDFFNLTNRTVSLAESFSINDVTQTVGSEPSDFLEGLSRQPSELFDHVFVRTLTNKVLAAFPFTNGSDLYALNIQRGRDHGIPGYNAWRKFCNLSVVPDFDTLLTDKIMRPEAVAAFQETYHSVDDIDLFPAGVAELAVGDALVGPVLSCIIGQNFRNIKFGDRFWFESSTQPKPFTEEQLDAIRHTRISTLICHFSTVEAIQPRALLRPALLNMAVPCQVLSRNNVIHRFDELW